ncbi:MAG: hypothetical protein QOJ78_1683 [Pseudonocardiales bacterium]|nr:hypothetical protein [Pseudonocardiales bacterium]
MPKVQPITEDYFASAPVRFAATFHIPRPAADVWSELVSDRPLRWCRVLNIRWTSARPFGVGTTRRAKILGGVLIVDERYFLWEEGRRMAFSVESANLPMFTHLAEDYLVEANGPDACTFTWRAGLEPTLLGKAGGPVNGLLFKSIFADTRRHFGAQ